MAGRITADAPHLDGTEPIGVWFDVAWAAYMEIILKMGAVGVQQEVLDDLWGELAAELTPDGQPTPESWGTSQQAQQGQAAMFAMFGATPDMGAAPTVGDEG